MKLEQAFEVQAPIERVWEALIDLERVAPCLPGATITDHDEDGTYHGEFKVKLGPTTASYRGTVKIEEADEATHPPRCAPRAPTSAARAAPTRRSSTRSPPTAATHARRGRHRLHDHRPARPLRPRRHDRGHLQPADARLLDLPAEPHRAPTSRAPSGEAVTTGAEAPEAVAGADPDPAPSAADAGVQPPGAPAPAPPPPPPPPPAPRQADQRLLAVLRGAPGPDQAPVRRGRRR